MNTAYYYLGLSAVLTILLWIPYILARVAVWGIPVFLSNYPEGFPAKQPAQPLWALRAQRAHLNMVETLPAFIAVVLGAGLLLGDDAVAVQNVVFWSQVFFWSRVFHAVVYTLGVPYLRTPVYLVSWASILTIAAQFLL